MDSLEKVVKDALAYSENHGHSDRALYVGSAVLAYLDKRRDVERSTVDRSCTAMREVYDGIDVVRGMHEAHDPEEVRAFEPRYVDALAEARELHIKARLRLGYYEGVVTLWYCRKDDIFGRWEYAGEAPWSMERRVLGPYEGDLTLDDLKLVEHAVDLKLIEHAVDLAIRKDAADEEHDRVVASILRNNPGFTREEVEAAYDGHPDLFEEQLVERVLEARAGS